MFAYTVIRGVGHKDGYHKHGSIKTPYSPALRSPNCQTSHSLVCCDTTLAFGENRGVYPPIWCKSRTNVRPWHHITIAGLDCTKLLQETKMVRHEDNNILPQKIKGCTQQGNIPVRWLFEKLRSISDLEAPHKCGRDPMQTKCRDHQCQHRGPPSWWPWASDV